MAIDLLMVEDNPDDVELALRAMRKSNAGNRIHIARNGKEALDFIFHEGEYEGKDIPTPGLILMDIKLPKVSGLEVLKRIKESPEKKKIPVIMLTLSEDKRDIDESYRLGANSYIIKPVGFSKFVDTIINIEYYWILLNRLPEV